MLRQLRSWRNRVWVWWWSFRLLGHRVDPAIVMIQATYSWHFVVEDGVYKFKSKRFDKYRLHLHTNPDTGRIESISIR